MHSPVVPVHDEFHDPGNPVILWQDQVPTASPTAVVPPVEAFPTPFSAEVCAVSSVMKPGNEDRIELLLQRSREGDAAASDEVLAALYLDG